MMKKMTYATIVIATNRTQAQRMRRIRYWSTVFDDRPNVVRMNRVFPYVCPASR